MIVDVWWEVGSETVGVNDLFELVLETDARPRQA